MPEIRDEKETRVEALLVGGELVGARTGSPRRVRRGVVRIDSGGQRTGDAERRDRDEAVVPGVVIVLALVIGNVEPDVDRGRANRLLNFRPVLRA
jgi:hypothetical protein